MVGKTALLIGRSLLVNKPLEIILRDWLNMDVAVVHSNSDIAIGTNKLKLIVSAVGNNVNLSDYGVDIYNLPKDTIIYDVGIFRDEQTGKIRGDFTGQNLPNCTPVPGGVGRLTTLSFISNAIDLLQKFEN